MKKFGLFGLIISLLFLFPCGCKEKSQPPAGIPHSDSLDLRKYREAETLNSLLEKDPDNVKALIRLGNIYFDTGQNEKAVEAYKKALRRDPENADVRTDMGICLRRLKRIDEAINAFKGAIKSNPRHYQSRYNLGLVLLHEKNDLNGAITVWEDLLKAVPEFPGKENLALQLEQLKQVEGTREREGSR